MLKATERYPQFKEIFDHEGIVVIPSFFDDEFLKALSSYFAREFKKTVVFEEYDEFLLDDKALLIRLYHIFNSENFIQALEQGLGLVFSKCNPRLYYNDKTCTNLPWHDDSYSSDRFAAMRIELSETAYEGGGFHFHDRVTDKITSVEKMNYGDAVLIKLKENKLFHMVDPIISGTRRSIILFLTR